MLEIYSEKKEGLGKDEFVENNLSNLKSELFDLVDYKIETCNTAWYRNIYIGYLIDIDSLSANGNVWGIDKIPQGFMSELFFLNACNQVGIDCQPSTGEDDIIGVDFRLQDEKETRFFDICINSKEKNLTESILEGHFPILFVPWRNMDYGMSYAEAYVRYGCFNGKRFLERTVKKNEEILFKLKGDIDKKKYPEIYGEEGNGFNFPKCDIQYYNNFVGTLSLLERNLSKN